MTTNEVMVESWRGRLRGAGLTSLTALLEPGPPAERLPGEWTPLSKPGLGGRERWRWQPAGLDAPLYVKRYFRTPWRTQLDRLRRQAARHSRAWWEHQQTQDLALQSVPAVRSLGAAERMQGLWERRSAVVFEQVGGDAFDRRWPQAVARGAPVTRGALRHALTRRLAQFVSAFHQTGACHRDLYLCHIFTELDESGRTPPKFALIDLARVHRPRWRRTRWLIKDLAQLDTSARPLGATCTDRLRFLYTYLGLQPAAPRVRWFARRITRKSDRILRRIARTSRTP